MKAKAAKKAPAAAVKPEAQPEAKPAAKKTAPATDRFGSREGSQAAAINAAITTSPQDVEALVAASKQTAARVRSHLKHLIEKGLIVESAKGFAAKAK